MKHLFYNIKLFYILLILFIPLGLKAQYIDTLVYEDNINETGTIIKPTESSKAKRMLYKRRGYINTTIPSYIPDSLMTSINAALEIWKCYMYSEDTLHLKISYSSLSSGDISTKVLYYSPDRTTYYPMALARKNYEILDNTIDAEITINSNTNWNIGIGTISPTAHNLTYGLMRAIATAMGFGSSLQAKERRGELKFNFNPGHTLFDKLIFNENDDRLDSFSNTSTSGLNQFAQPPTGYLYIYKKLNEYQLYAPEEFDNNKSLRYLITPNSLMSSNIPSDTLDLTIDYITLDILKAIGWDITDNNIEIIGEGIDSTGITSAYQSHRFYLNTTSSVSNHTWYFTLPLATGRDTIITQSNNSDFIIPAITNEYLYKHSIEGDIHGVITFTGLINGSEIKETYNITLELKPRIISAEITEISDCSEDNEFYDITIKVKYEGAYNITALLEEEYSPWITMYTSHIPYQTCIRINSIDGWGYAWIELSANNKYGEDTYVIELPNILSSSKHKNNESSSKIMIKSVDFDYDYFNYDIGYLINPKFKICFETDNINGFMLKRWKHDENTPYFEDNINITQIDEYTYILEDGQTGVYNIGDVFLLCTQHSYSDTIFVDNYVEKDILDSYYGVSSINNIFSNDNINIKITENEIITKNKNICKLKLCNTSGATLRQATGNSINIKSLPKGIYIITIITKEGTLIRKITL